MAPSPFFHEASGAVRFWVLIDGGRYVGASITKETLHYRFHANLSGTDAVATYEAHHRSIDEAVRSRLARGSLPPVLLREVDVAKTETDSR